MKGLFLKIFGWFWLTTIITITATYWLSAQVFDNDKSHPRLNELLSHYIEEVENQLAGQSLPDFSNWLNRQRFPRGVGVSIVDNQGTIVATKGIPKPFVHHYKQHQSWPFSSNKHFRIEEKWINGDQKLKLSAVLIPRKSHMDSPHPDHWLSNFNKRTRGWGIFRLFIALGISAIVCYLLARYLAKPITRLRNTVNDLGKGNFETNVAAQFGNRNDEISELAVDIDDMATKLRDQFKRREDLLRDISHELRSPLARMRIASELIKSKAQDLELKEINQLESDIALIDNLIEEILTFSRLNDKNRDINLSTVDIRELLASILVNANFEAKSQHKQVSLSSDDNQNYSLQGNQALLERAFENIIRNAIKYTPAHTAVSVDLEQVADFITISISDHGPGVNDDQLEKIFEPFYRVSDSRSRDSGGSGLGLAICKRAIELHHGTIIADNLPADGLVITMRLPLSATQGN